MASAAAPLKRKAGSQSTEAGDLSLLRALRQRSLPLELLMSEGKLVLRVGAIDIVCPERYARRCYALQNAPHGHLTKAVDVFASWLLKAWTRDVEGEAETVAHGAPDSSQQHIKNTFESLTESDFLGDELGVKVYTDKAFALLMAAPPACELTRLELSQFYDKRCPLPLRLLAELPEQLARRVIELGPAAVLDRLPLDSRAAPIVCKVYNEWALRQAQSNPDVYFEEPWTLCGPHMHLGLNWDSASDNPIVWAPRSAVADCAGVPVRIRVDYEAWRQSYSGRFPGLHVFEVLADSHYTVTTLELDDDVERLAFKSDCLAHCWKDLRLPANLTHLWLKPNYLVGDECEEEAPPVRRMPLSWLRIPSRLQYLNLYTDRVDVTDAALPESLTSLHLNACRDVEVHPDDPDQLEADMTRLRLPSALRELVVDDVNMGPRGLCGVALPPALEVLAWTSSRPVPEPLQAIELPASLTKLYLVGGCEAGPDAPGTALPAKLRELVLPAYHVVGACLAFLTALTNLEIVSLRPDSAAALCARELFPPRLCRLKLDSPVFGDSGWMRRTVLPGTLTELRLYRADMGSETLEHVAWPASLRMLFIYGDSRSDAAPPTCTPQQLPETLETLILDDVKLCLQGVRLPCSLSSVYLHDIVFAGDDALAVTWPASLRELSITGRGFGRVADLPVLCLPDSVTALSLQSMRLARDNATYLRLPYALKKLVLNSAVFGKGGLQSVILPPRLTQLSMKDVKLGVCGYQNVVLPGSLQLLVLQCKCDVEEGEAEPEQQATWVSQGLAWPQSLRALVLWRPEVDQLKAMCQQLQGLKHLKVLAVCGCAVSYANVAAWLGRRKGLRVLVQEGIGLAANNQYGSGLEAWARESCGLAS